ncbi:MAG: nucleotidyltransferase domain-containing protein [Oscillospiraceae bacterium]|nr:nucleotidyltransferase domain-containing protein [Oscillospiraceae bacterium]
MNSKQEKEFWNIIEVFNAEDLLKHVMIIGSWAEYLYQYFIKPEFKANLRTTDVDFLYYNLQRPVGKKIEIVRALENKGFVSTQNRYSGVTKFIKEGVLDIEFLIRVLGEGNPQHQKIPSLGIVGIGLRDVNMLEQYPLEIEINGYSLIVPAPEIFVLHKTLISSKRQKPEKREKDLDTVRKGITTC